MTHDERSEEELLREIQTLRKSLETLLPGFQEKEGRLRLLEALVEGVEQPVFVKDLEGRYLFGNRAIAELSGLAVRDLLGKNDLEVFGEDLGLELMREDRSVLKAGKTRTFEKTRAYPVGTRHVVATKGVFRDSDGNPLGVFGVTRDVTENRRVTRELNLLTEAVKTSTEVIFLTDLQGVFTYVNPAFTRLYGWEAEQVVGKKTPRILKSGLYGEDYYNGLWRRLLAGKAVEREFKNRKRNGELVDVRASANAVLDEGGRPVAFLAIQSDITAWKRHEETVLTIARGVSGSTGEGFFRDLARHLARAVNAEVAMVGRLVGDDLDRIQTLAVEADGEPGETFTYALAGTPCEKALAQDGCVEARDVQARFPLNESLRRLGAQAYVGKALRDSRGQPLGVMLVLFREPLLDPTLAVSMMEIFAARAAAEMERVHSEAQRRRLEEQLRQAQKMEEIGQLTGGIAHDFQNLLSVILLNTELLKDSLESGRPVLLSEIREVEDAARQAAAMTKKLLGFGRRADLALAPTDLGKVVQGMASMLRRVIPENIDLRIRIQENPGTVRADPGAVEQILLNLATNARDAMPGGGCLSVEVGEVGLTAAAARRIPGGRPGRFLRVSVTDDGIGMDDLVLKRVFEPFFTTKPVGEGTGLGLAMVHGLTQQHGGFIQVESEPGKGTSVRLHLPLLEKTPEAEGEEEERTAVAGGSETILLVEDQPALRRTLKMVLERAGYGVLMAEDGVEGLELARMHQGLVRLIISDLVMPRMGGLELFRALRAEGNPVRFIMASGYAGKSAAGLAELDYTVPVLKKPWKPKELLRVVREVLDRPL